MVVVVVRKKLKLFLLLHELVGEKVSYIELAQNLFAVQLKNNLESEKTDHAEL